MKDIKYSNYDTHSSAVNFPRNIKSEICKILTDGTEKYHLSPNV